jgi:hypothetical protein
VANEGKLTASSTALETNDSFLALPIFSSDQRNKYEHNGGASSIENTELEVISRVKGRFVRD